MKLNNPITQEPMESEIDFQIMMVLHNTNHKVNPYGDSTVSQLRTLFSKWLKQEREKGISEMIELVRQWAEDHDNQIEDEAWKMLEAVLGRKIFKFT